MEHASVLFVEILIGIKFYCIYSMEIIFFLAENLLDCIHLKSRLYLVFVEK